MGAFNKAKNIVEDVAIAKHVVDEVTGKTKGKESEEKGRGGRSEAEQKREKRGAEHARHKGGARR